MKFVRYYIEEEKGRRKDLVEAERGAIGSFLRGWRSHHTDSLIHFHLEGCSQKLHCHAMARYTYNKLNERQSEQMRGERVLPGRDEGFLYLLSSIAVWPCPVFPTSM